MVMNPARLAATAGTGFHRKIFRVSRRELLLLGTGLAWPWAGACSTRRTTRPVAAEDEVEMSRRIARFIAAYDAQGIHRTGTEVDHASGRWLAREVEALGLEAHLDGLTLSRVDVQTASVTVGQRRVDGLPLFDGSFTGADGVEGKLEGLEGSAGIGVANVPPAGPRRNEFHRHRRGTGQRALIAVTGGEAWSLPPGLTPLNADAYRSPYGPPVLQLGSENWPWLQEAIRDRARARVVVEVARRETEVFNVTAELRGRQPGLAPVVVMTPRSGWWNCASERGGGIALWLEVLRALVDLGPERSVYFAATTGHELGHLGLDHYLDEHAQLVEGAVAWIHLGANFAARVRPGVRLQVSDEKLHRLALDAMARYGSRPDVETPVGERPLGEARNIFDGGGRYLSLLGTNGLFHHPGDRWPRAVDIPRTVALARAFCDLARNLAGA